jgi:TPR repeat protein
MQAHDRVINLLLQLEPRSQNPPPPETRYVKGEIDEVRLRENIRRAMEEFAPAPVQQIIAAPQALAAPAPAPQTRIVEVPKIEIREIQVPVPYEVQKIVEVPKEVYIEKIVEKIVSAPTDPILKAHASFFGHGVEKNLQEALRLYREADAMNLAPATNCLAKIFLEGLGVPKNTEAVSTK